MRRTFIIGQLCCAASLVAVAAAQQLAGLDDAPLGATRPVGSDAARRLSADATFAKTDLNGDGVLSGKEAKAVAEHFDGDGDGRISRAEFDAGRAADRGALAASARRRAAEQMFRARDLTEDEALTGTERAGLEGRDADGDGRITLGEFAAAAEALGGTLAPHGAQPTAEQLARFASLDENEDGRLSGTEIAAEDKRLDADGDGRITRSEYCTAHNGAAGDLAAHYDAGKIRLMLIGVSRYADRPPTCATPDVRLLENALGRILPEEKYGGKVAADDNPKPQQSPTRAVIAGAGGDVVRSARPEDTLLFFLAGRAALVGEQAFFCPPEFDAAQPVQTGLGFADFAASLGECRARHKLLILDLCNFDEAAPAAAAATLQTRIESGLAYAPGLTTLGYLAPRGESLLAPGRTYGMLAEAVVAALEGRGDIDQDGLVSADELHAYAEAAIAHAARRAGSEAPRAPWRIVGPGPVETFGLARVEANDPTRELADANPDEKAAAADGQAETKEFVNSIGMKFVYSPPAEFLVGSPDRHPHHKDDEELRSMKRTYPLYFGRHEVTQGQYAAVMGSRPAHHSQAAGYDDRYPVEQVSWTDAYEFCKLLSDSPAEVARERAYRLPTECEWEQACGAGDAKSVVYFHTGMTISSEQANVRGDRPIGDSPAGVFLNRTQPVGSYAPNKLGLYDMHGNVAEWCLDWYVADRFVGLRVDLPIADFVAQEGTLKTVRGGDYLGDVAYCRAAARRSFDPEYRYKSLGFRVVCYRPQPAAEK